MVFASDGYDYDNKYIIEGYCPFLYKYIKRDKDFILNIYRLWPHYLMQCNILYKLAPKELLKSKDFFSEIFKLKIKGEHNWSWTHFPNHFWNDKEFVFEAVSRNGAALKYASDKLKDNKEIVIVAVKNNRNAFDYASTRLKKDSEIASFVIT